MALFQVNNDRSLKAVYNIWDNPEVTPRGQWKFFITDKGLVLSISQYISLVQANITLHGIKCHRQKFQADTITGLFMT